jgi:ERCC4-type nuclease
MSDFKIIIDTREKQPWSFAEYTTANKKLDTGDYSIEGLENILCIERKRDIAEIAHNITEKRFKDCIERMSQYKHAFMLLECDYAQMMHYPYGSNVPQYLWKKIQVSPAYILKFITELSILHNIHVVFCGTSEAAEKTAISIMKRVYTQYGNTTT